MPQKTINKIFRYVQERGYSHISLEKKDNKLICQYGPNNYWQLPAETEEHIINLFREILGASDNEYIHNKRFKINDKNNIISGRASISPSYQGDKLTITLTNTKPSIKRISALGLNKEQQKQIKQALNKKTGVIIITSHEENGASSTYHSLLSLINPAKSLYSIEDFPYHQLSGINIIKPQTYGGISSSLQLLSRLDSDIIALDVQLDGKDLKPIWQAAHSRLIILTLPHSSGHQVLKFLKKSGLSTQTITDRLILISIQKLFPRLCLHCLKPLAEDKNLKKIIIQKWPLALRHWPKHSYFQHSCNRCRNKNNIKETAIFEFMSFDKTAKLTENYRPLILEALAKAELGLISLEEIADWAKEDKKI